MSQDTKKLIQETCEKYGKDRTRMMDIVQDVQQALGCVDAASIDMIAETTSTPRVVIEGVVSFYTFFSECPQGKIVIRLCDDIIDEMSGSARVAEALKEALGIDFGETTADGRITLEYTPCIGMSDQAPAALVNDVIVTDLDPDKARSMVQMLKESGDPSNLVRRLGDGNNADDRVRSMVVNNIRKKGPVIFDAFQSGEALQKALAMSPAEVIRDVKTSRLRGRGGAGFPTGMKWDFTRQTKSDNRYVVCNADEGEPGTFKDRAILTECPDLMFEGMTIAGYAIGGHNGILYLRGEYVYLREFLESVLQKRRDAGLLGENIGGKEGFNFDIRIQMGAGAYICGEETSLLSSCEGLRGDPKTRPPFPAQKGYLQSPTTVNNVETFCCVTRILDKGPGWFGQIGSKGSAGTKLLSVSGDCARPGVYETPFGIKLKDLLELVGATDTAAVQIGGPSGQLVGPAAFDRCICYDDLATGGSVMIFNSTRDLTEVVSKFMEFFIDESCGYCTPCRVGNVLLKDRLDLIRAGKGEPKDLDYLRDLCGTVKFASRCGLGQTSPNPVLSLLDNFDEQCRKLVEQQGEGFQRTFDLKAALAVAEEVQGRTSVHF